MSLATQSHPLGGEETETRSQRHKSEHGDELSLNIVRGLCEPSMIAFRDRFYPTIRKDLDGMRPGQQAGFARFGGIYHLLGVQVERDGVRRLSFDANGRITSGPVVDATRLYIRTANDGNQARFAWRRRSPDIP